MPVTLTDDFFTLEYISTDTPMRTGFKETPLLLAVTEELAVRITDTSISAGGLPALAAQVGTLGIYTRLRHTLAQDYGTASGFLRGGGRNLAVASSFQDIINGGTTGNYTNSFYCTGLEIAPLTATSTRDFRVTATWLAPGLSSIWKMGYYQTQEIRNFDKDWNPTTVQYTSSAFSPSATPNAWKPHPADIRVPRGIPILEITQYADMSTATGNYWASLAGCMGTVSAFGALAPICVVNSTTWNNFAPRTVMYVGAGLESTGTPLMLYHGVFNCDPRTFDKFALYLYGNGTKPPDLEALSAGDLANASLVKNGLKRFHMLTETDFNTYFSFLKPPFLGAGNLSP